MLGRRGLLGAALSASLLTSGRLGAEEPARFSYVAPAGCPSVDEFVARVRERSLHERPAAADELALSFTVSVSTDATGVVGRVEFPDRDGTLASRAVRGATCDEVVTSIALVTALAIDARAEAEPVSMPAMQPVAPPPRVTPAPLPPERARAGDPPPEVSTTFFTAGFGGGFQSFAGPTGGAAFDAFLAASPGPRRAALRLSAWHWRASGATSGTTGSREAVFRAWGGRLDGCPFTFEAHGVFAAPCTGFDLGLLRAAGLKSASLPLPKPASIAWADAVLLGRVGVVLGRLVVLEAETALTFPLVREDFGFSKPPPPQKLYSVPIVGASATLHAGVRFP